LELEPKVFQKGRELPNKQTISLKEKPLRFSLVYVGGMQKEHNKPSVVLNKASQTCWPCQ